VRIPHGQYVRGAARVVDAFDLGPEDVFHNWLPLFHLGGQLHMTMTAVICGGAVALFPRFSRSGFRGEIETTRASVLCGFASILNVIWSIPEREGDHLGSLRIGIFAGIPPQLHAPFERRFGMRLAENYGMTEADPITLPRAGRPAPKGSCGFPTDDFEVAIFDEHDLPAPAGAVGEIVVRARAADVMSHG
jgi:crotonobetaine/carnitine-CoA ligase